MEQEVTNLEWGEVEAITKRFNLEPRGRDVIITVNTIEDTDESGVKLTSNDFSDVQYVMAAGSHVHDLLPGDKVLLDLEKMSVRIPNAENIYESATQIKIFPVEFEDRMYALVSDNVIKVKIK